MTFLIFVVSVVIAYLAWRIVDRLPDIVYRLGEIQRDVADLRRRVEARDAVAPATAEPNSDDQAADD